MSSKFPDDIARIGQDFQNGTHHRFMGMLDEIKVFNRALTVDGIRSQMCKRIFGKVDGLIGYWNFDETTGDQIFDQSQNGYHGIIKGGAKRVFSGAPVGDESVNLYTSNWNAATATIGVLSVSDINGDPYGVHLYKVNSKPSQTGGLNLSAIDDEYYGIFLASNDDGNSCIRSLDCVFNRNENSEANWQGVAENMVIDRGEFIQSSGSLSFELGKDTILCNKNSYTLSTGISNSAQSFLWSTGEITSTISVTESGKYTVTVKEGCKQGIDEIRVEFSQDPPEFSLGEDDLLCTLEQRVLEPYDEPGMVEYTWQDGSDGPEFNAVGPGVYWVEVKNQCGIYRDSIIFTQTPSEEFDFDLGEDTVICDSNSLRLSTGLKESPGKSFKWNTGHTSSEITASENGRYVVFVSNGCLVVTDTIEIQFMSAPPNFSLGEDELSCSLKSKKLKPYDNPIQATYIWQDGSDKTELEINHFGIFWVEVRNACGYSRDTIEFKKLDESTLLVPNVVTPNEEDTLNTFFEIHPKIDEPVALQIFNRWGTKIYESKEYKNNWSGRDYAVGIYFYMISHPCLGNKKGAIHVVK